MARSFADGDELYRLHIYRTWTIDGEAKTTESTQGPYPTLGTARGQRTARQNDLTHYPTPWLTETVTIEKAVQVWEAVE